MAKIKPLPGRIIIEIVTRSDSRAKAAAEAGILLHDAEIEGAPNEGIVYAVPPGVDPEIQVGRRVFYKEETPRGFKIDDRPLLGLWESQILGVAV
jgi:co-chaperonin GroES (HSP10)